MKKANPHNLPRSPFPGIDPYGYYERKIFFARRQEVRSLIRLIVIHRGVLLYSMSGTGKSSLINAGLVPKAIEEGYKPERIRLQPISNEEIIVERISEEKANEPPFLSSIFPFEEKQTRLVLSIDNFFETINKNASKAKPLLIFDQFEEWITLFESMHEGVKRCQESIVNLISKILNDNQLPVKILITFREDYLAQMTPLFKLCPNLADNYLRLTTLRSDSIIEIVRGPFDKYPDFYTNEISLEIAHEIKKQFEERNQDEGYYLSELQIICQSFLDKKNAKTNFEEMFGEKGGVKGLIEDYLEQKIRLLPDEQKESVIPLLNRMVTSAGTRNVILKDDLLSRVETEEKLPRKLLEKTLNNLEQHIKLVRREIRREVYYYEIVSEFLIDWIKKSYRKHEQDKALKNYKRAAIEAEEKFREANITVKSFRQDLAKQTISNQRLSRLIGFFGLSLPLLLILTNYFLDKSLGIQESIAAYYFTSARDLYVGIFVTIAMVLFIYQGYSRWDNIVTNLGALFTLGMVYFPNYSQHTIIRANSFILSITHSFFSAMFFLTMAYISLFIFTKSAVAASSAKLKRNKVYLICGIIILTSVVSISLDQTLLINLLSRHGVHNLVFWLETLAFTAFGISWLTKGGAIIMDVMK